MPDIDATITAGVEAGGYRIGATTADAWYQRVIPVRDRIVAYRGRAGTFRTPGRAGTAGQNIMAIHNATASAVIVDVSQINIDVYMTVVKLITVAPPMIRLNKVTALPTGGTALGKVSEDSALTTNASLTLFQDASADGTSSAGALAATIPANSVVTQEIAPRFISAAGYEMADRIEFLGAGPIILRALEGLVVRLDYTAAGQNPITDMWAATVRWEEYTRP